MNEKEIARIRDEQRIQKREKENEHGGRRKKEFIGLTRIKRNEG